MPGNAAGERFHNLVQSSVSLGTPAIAGQGRLIVPQDELVNLCRYPLIDTPGLRDGMPTQTLEMM